MIELKTHIFLKAQSMVILPPPLPTHTHTTPSHQPLINHQRRSPHVSRQEGKKLRCNSSRSHLKATKQQRPCAHSCPHTCHHMLAGRIVFAGVTPSVFATSQAARHATLAAVLSRTFSFPSRISPPPARGEAQVSWFQSATTTRKSEVKPERDAVSPSSKQDFLHPTVLIDR